MPWTQPQKTAFRKALLFAYRDHNALKIFLADAIGLSLDEVAAPGTLESAAFQVIDTAEAKGLLDGLHRKFCEANPHHPDVQQSSPSPAAAPRDRDQATPPSPAPPQQPAPQPPTPQPSTSENPRAVILTALDVEFEAVREFLAPTSEIVHRGAVYEQGHFTGQHHQWDLLLVQAGHGNNDAALETSKAIEYFKPSVVLFVGVAGGLKDVAIGDVVAASQVYGYESYKAAETIQPRIKTEQSSYALVNRARAEKRKRAWHWRLKDVVPDVYVAPIAAGEKVVASTKSAVYESLRTYCSDAVAVEMEGYGFLRAAYAHQPLDCLVVRGISDLIDNKNEMPNELPEYQRQQNASRHAAAFALQVLDAHQIEGSMLGQSPSPKVDLSEWDRLRECLQTEALDMIAPLLVQTFHQELSDIERLSYPELNRLDRWEQIATVLKRRDRIDLAVAWVKRIMDERCRNNRDIPIAIADWYCQHSLEPYTPPASEVANAPEKKPEARLVMTFQPVDDGEEVWVSAELHRSPDDEAPITLLDPEYKADLSKGGQCVDRALRAALDKAGCDRSEIVSFELFLSWIHLHEPVARWQIRSGMRTRALWQEDWGVMVRMLDRVRDPDYFKTWQNRLNARWQTLPDIGTVIPKTCRYQCDAEPCDDPYFRSLDLTLRDGPWSSFVRWGSFPDAREVKQELAGILMDAGIPMMLWSLHDLCASTRQRFRVLTEKLLQKANPYDATAFLPALRAAHGGNEDSPLMHMGLICDRPDFLPHDLDRLQLRQN